MKTILITGAYGFVGTNLANYLKDRYRLWALDIQEQNKNLYDKFFSWDDFESLPWNDVDMIIHLAGKAHDTKNTTDAQAYFDINTKLTMRVFDEFLASTCKQFLFFSSVKAAADKVDGDILTENIVPKPIGPYGESKIEAENYIQSKDFGDKKVYIFRPCMIHGPGNKGNLNLLFGVINKGIPYPLGKFDNKRSFTSIENLCFIIHKTIELNIESGIYNIGDDTPMSTNKLIQIMCAVLGKKDKIWYLPKGLVNLGAHVGDVLHLPLNTFRLNKLIENYVVSNEKIKKAIQVTSLPVTSENGIKQTIQSFKN